METLAAPAVPAAPAAPAAPAGPAAPVGEPGGAHLLVDAVAVVRRALGTVRDVAAATLSDRQLAALMVQTGAAAAQTDELRLRLVAETDRRRLAGTGGATSTAAAVAAGQRTSRHAAGAAVRLATSLDTDCRQTRAAMAAGTINTEQATLITRTMHSCPAPPPPSRRPTPKHGCSTRPPTPDPTSSGSSPGGPTTPSPPAATVPPTAPPTAAPQTGLPQTAVPQMPGGGGQTHEGRLLLAEERAARDRTRLWMRPGGDGLTHGGFSIPDAQAAMLTVVLDAVVAPRRPGAAAAEPGRPGAAAAEPADRLGWDQRRGHALCELIEHLPVDGLPHAGRAAATVVVTLGYDRLTAGLGAATLSTGQRTTAGHARRLACNAGLLPMVLSGDSVPLDLGRTGRFFSWHQRLALAHTQHGCIADGCDRPPAWCEVHHLHPWTQNGHTDLADGVLLSGWHHHLVHDTGWTAHLAPDGIPELVPPAHHDPTRTPIRHRRFPPPSPTRPPRPANAGPSPPPPPPQPTRTTRC